MTLPRAAVCRTSLLCTFMCFSTLLLGQSIQNLRTSFQDGRVSIVYDLVGATDRKYAIEVFGSHNGFATPLQQVSGDVGRNVTAGPSKRIEWLAAGELGAFKGQIIFRISGEVLPLSLTLTSPTEKATLRLGKTTQLKWHGGVPAQTVRIELLKNGTPVQPIKDVDNTGSYAWAVPEGLEQGTYQVRITAGSETSLGGSFNIKKKIPLWLKLSPIAVVGVVAILLIGGDDETPKGDEDLPNAPLPD